MVWEALLSGFYFLFSEARYLAVCILNIVLKINKNPESEALQTLKPSNYQTFLFNRRQQHGDMFYHSAYLLFIEGIIVAPYLPRCIGKGIIV